MADPNLILQPAFIDTRSMRAGRIPPIARRLQRNAARALQVVMGYAPELPEDERVLLTDLSHHNGTVDLVKMRAAGAAGFYQKATEGIYNWIDPTAAVRTQAAKEIGYPYGLYHFLRNQLGTSQADIFNLKTKAIGIGQLTPIADAEIAMPASVIKSFAIRIYDLFGMYPLVYTSYYCWKLITGDDDKRWVAQHCGLHVAHWGVASPLIPSEWVTYTLHQFAGENNGRAAEFGCTGGDPDIDLNWAKKTWFNALVEPSPVPPAPPAPPSPSYQYGKVLRPLNVRTSPSTYSNIITALPAGLVVRIFETREIGGNVWARVTGSYWCAQKFAGTVHIELEE